MGGEGGGLGLSPLSRSRSYIMSDPIERVRFRVLGRSWGGGGGARESGALLEQRANTRGEADGEQLRLA